jgi:hypothetical protein
MAAYQPLDPDGFWYIAKAICLAQGNAATQKSIEVYGKAKYRIYCGGTDDRCDQIVVSALKQSSPPVGFSHTINKTR